MQLTALLQQWSSSFHRNHGCQELSFIPSFLLMGGRVLWFFNLCLLPLEFRAPGEVVWLCWPADAICWGLPKELNWLTIFFQGSHSILVNFKASLNECIFSLSVSVSEAMSSCLSHMSWLWVYAVALLIQQIFRSLNIAGRSNRVQSLWIQVTVTEII